MLHRPFVEISDVKLLYRGDLCAEIAIVLEDRFGWCMTMPGTFIRITMEIPSHAPPERGHWYLDEMHENE